MLQRVNFDEAMEHLSLVLGRCLLFALAASLRPLDWTALETIQWLAVGLTIGLGFAMQDIVRNLLADSLSCLRSPRVWEI